MSKITMLGAFGGKSKTGSTTSLLVSDSVVIDGGNIMQPLDNAAKEIDHIFLTHCHMDHIVDIPFLIDAFFASRTKPLTIYGLPHTLKALKKYILNWDIWPDFNEIMLMNQSDKSVLLKEIEFDKVYDEGGVKLTPFETAHTVPSCGFIIEKDNKKAMFTSDTYLTENIWDTVNKDKNIKALILECSFTSDMEQLAINSKHLTPVMVKTVIDKIYRDDLKVYINHMKPDFVDRLKKEFEDLGLLNDGHLILLDDGYEIEF
ncbi:MAG: 3',5'-cyclic-nucleotide phosphodiesterase [Campylobacterales bacterium]|nr:3',5'-cyclic-nucleotide phosphodiesterase [Campylobacterales bacterium]